MTNLWPHSAPTRLHAIIRKMQRRQQEVATYTQAALFGRTAPQRILIFAQGRTGTWLMTHFLNAHPEVQCEKEILMFPKYSPQRYLAARSRLNEGKLYGCHVQINQLLTAQKVEPGQFLRRLSAENWQLIHLTRQDIVRQSISTILATRRRQWYTYNLAEIDQRPLIIPPSELEQWLQRRVAHQKLEAAALRDLPHLSITYERDLRAAVNHQQTMDRVFDFLKLPKIPVKAQTRRLSGNTLRDSIANYDTLIDSIRATQFAQFTDLC